MTALRYDVLPTPGGPLTVVVDPDAVGDHGPTAYGAVVRSGFGDPADTLARLPQDLHGRTVERGDVGAVAVAVAAWAAGDVAALDSVSVVQEGGQFLQRAWAAMREIGPGETDTYTGLAGRAGNPRAARAAGSACARNQVAPFVPCHRVLAAGGSLGGYYYGLDLKRALLDHEAAAVTPGGSA